MVSAMGVDAFLTRSINELAGQSSWMDWWFLYLSDPDVLWLPGILLGIYWLWLSPREAVIGGLSLGASIGLFGFSGGANQTSGGPSTALHEHVGSASAAGLRQDV